MFKIWTHAYSSADWYNDNEEYHHDYYNHPAINNFD